MNEPNIYKSYFEKYTSLVSEKNINDALQNQVEKINNFCNEISEEKSTFAYAEAKWTLKEMLQHMIDTERIFAYRALAIARKELETLPGFDENLYAANSKANARSWGALVEEMKALRKTTELLFNSFTSEMLETTGNFGSNKGSVNTLGFIIAGHVYHHIKIAKERYF